LTEGLYFGSSGKYGMLLDDSETPSEMWYFNVWTFEHEIKGEYSGIYERTKLETREYRLLLKRDVLWVIGK
jgi:hypothetical protein